MKDTFVANSFTGELFAVDGYVVKATIFRKELRDRKVKDVFWTKRSQTIYDLLRSGW